MKREVLNGTVKTGQGVCAIALLTGRASIAGCRVASLTVVSGTAGISDAGQRQARREKDDGLAQALLAQGLPAFVETWYQQPMWQSLRSHARCVSGSQ